MQNNKYEILAFNYRGCGGEPNRKLTSFHGGKTDDLDWVIKHAIASNDYDAIYLVGVSMGGNLTLKYVGEMKHKLNKIIKKAFAVSAPIDMLATSHQLIKGWNQIYSRRYLKQYIEQLKLKEKLFPGQWILKKYINLLTYTISLKILQQKYLDLKMLLNIQLLKVPCIISKI